MDLVAINYAVRITRSTGSAKFTNELPLTVGLQLWANPEQVVKTKSSGNNPHKRNKDRCQILANRQTYPRCFAQGCIDKYVGTSRENIDEGPNWNPNRK